MQSETVQLEPVSSAVILSLFLPFCSEVTTDDEDESPDSVDPDEIEVEMNYEPDPTDLVLSSVPGGDLFDPRKHKFSEEELKPQPMIKKAKKVFVPDEQKVCWKKEEPLQPTFYPTSRFCLFFCVLIRGKIP